jgi:hypothetical protein
MDLKKVKLPDGGKICKVHNFMYMYKGATWHLEVDEFGDGTVTGHGEHSTDKSSVLESVSAKSVEDCVAMLAAKVKK